MCLQCENRFTEWIEKCPECDAEQSICEIVWGGFNQDSD